MMVCAKLAFGLGSGRSFEWSFPHLVERFPLIWQFLNDNPIHLDSFCHCICDWVDSVWIQVFRSNWHMLIDNIVLHSLSLSPKRILSLIKESCIQLQKPQFLAIVCRTLFNRFSLYLVYVVKYHSLKPLFLQYPRAADQTWQGHILSSFCLGRQWMPCHCAIWVQVCQWSGRKVPAGSHFVVEISWRSLHSYSTVSPRVSTSHLCSNQKQS